MKEPRYTLFDDGRVIFRYDLPAEAPFSVEIRCPLPSKLHERDQEVMEQHRSWARSFAIPPSDGSYRRYCDTRLDLLATYQLYDLPIESAVLHSHLMTWFFVFDDVMDMDHGLQGEAEAYRSKLCRRHLDILVGSQPDKADPGCIRAFSDFLKQTEALGGEKFSFWYRRMVHHLREYIMGACWESMIGPTTHMNTNTALYLQVRHLAVGVAPCLDLMALAARIPAEPFGDNFYIQRADRLAINYSIWVNDLAGLNRDVKRGLGNVVFTLQRDHSLTLTDATRMVARMCDAELEALLQVERQLPMLLKDEYERNKRAYDAYIDVLKRWMRGLLDWSARTDRYQRLDVDMALQNDRLIRQASSKYFAD